MNRDMENAIRALKQHIAYNIPNAEGSYENETRYNQFQPREENARRVQNLGEIK